MNLGVLEWQIHQTPWAVVDLETTGLRAGPDRVVELSVVRVAPDGSSRLVLDTLVDPRRPMAATDVHGITDDDVRDAPTFRKLAPTFAEAVSGCVLATYNASFDMSFLRSELADAGISGRLPHVCLMWLRPALQLGNRCKLRDACAEHGILLEHAHASRDDALAAARLLGVCRDRIKALSLDTFARLQSVCPYKFTESFACNPLPAAVGGLSRPTLKPRAATKWPEAAPSLKDYWRELCAALSDLDLTESELNQVKAAARGLSPGQIRALHARAFGNILAQVGADRVVDDREADTLFRLQRCLRTLGWTPGDPTTA